MFWEIIAYGVTIRKDCKLTIIPEQAEAVKLIFQLYATGNYGLRKLSQELTRRGYTSLFGKQIQFRHHRPYSAKPKVQGVVLRQ